MIFQLARLQIQPLYSQLNTVHWKYKAPPAPRLQIITEHLTRICSKFCLDQLNVNWKKENTPFSPQNVEKTALFCLTLHIQRSTLNSRD